MPPDAGKYLSEKKLTALSRSKNDSLLIREGEKQALKNFHRAATTVPAYKKFLSANGVNPKSIETILDFQKLPETNKDNYIKKFSPAERSPGGNFASHRILAASSGTTGKPILWPRGSEQEAEAVAVHAFLFSELYELDKYRTLLVIGFPMGIYVSGMATALPSYFASLTHPNLTLLTAGNNKESILNILPSLQGEYQQIILAGHPFFVKDIIEAGARQGIRWGKNKIRTFFVSEGFNEEWREYVASKLPHTRSECSLFSMYGSSELLLMAYESPETILIRRAAEKNTALQEKLFHSRITPNLFQYNPALRYIETNPNGELIFTAWSGIPLVRYNLHDAGCVIPRGEMQKTLNSENITLDSGLRQAHWRPWSLPFVALYGRSDHMLVFYAVNIYPEHMREALNRGRFLKIITGKFTMEKKETSAKDQHLIVHVELQSGAKKTSALRRALERILVEALSRMSLEYKDASTHLGKDMRPRVVLHYFGDPAYFPPGLKPRYIRA